MTEVEKLEKWLVDNECSISGVTLGPGAYKMPPAERQEATAKEINRLNDWLAEGNNAEISRLKGKAFLLGDYIMCTRNRSRFNTETRDWEPCPPTDKELGIIASKQAKIEEIERKIAELSS